MDVSSPVVAIVGTDVKLSCSALQWTATEGYTVSGSALDLFNGAELDLFDAIFDLKITWSKNNTGEVLSKNLHVVADPSKYAVTTVTSSELGS
jgi:hypothetical protein